LASLKLLGDRLNAKLKRGQDATQALKNYALFAQPLCHFLKIIMIEDRPHRLRRKSKARDIARAARLSFRNVSVSVQ
jgi:hypothetical protein